ncbi:glycosyltransferase [Asaia prunellae]|uniref:glycosyltransferase n=1 Tax=Asaia prunellae TaxID=610245 RepID=UPI000AC2A715|nr:glycosyltransferase [Asaia prunellae]
MICDVSAEIAQLSRLCSVPHIKVLQHGDRSDEGHHAAYDGAIGLLAPFSERLAQPEWQGELRDRIFYAGGLGKADSLPEREIARQRLGLDAHREIILVMTGSGGTGFTVAPIAVGARSRPAALWITIGPMTRDWHATEPGNLVHHGWIEQVADYIAAADCVIASTGNTTCQQILAAGKPWLAIPEWRYFDEQHRKAACLAAAGMAITRPHLPSSALAWNCALAETYSRHDPETQRAAIDDLPSERTALWIEELIEHFWNDHPNPVREVTLP